MQKIQKVSGIIRTLILFLIALRVVFIFSVPVSVYNQSPALSNKTEVNIEYLVDVQSSWKGYATMLDNEQLNSQLILGLPEQLFILVIYCLLWRLFGFYQQGQVFSAEPINQLRIIAGCILLWPVITIIYPILTTLLLRFSGASDSLPIYVSIGTSEITNLITGLIVYVISWIMLEAQKVNEEQELTI
ncbi:DUF2975 domain-containing protein [Neptunicella marina]|uniref:DUF2975 domain-containing protein n=1 Tax=Neptunicella marina TaxID=2125989 RepID=A0A8J6M0J5_9ALTE|nr:DUF2975 domain-containing protein [Neptunicella marina]MBC3764858.1 DUF2975 domain-containing protein [Neptunicella marina]